MDEDLKDPRRNLQWGQTETHGAINALTDSLYQALPGSYIGKALAELERAITFHARSDPHFMQNLQEYLALHRTWDQERSERRQDLNPFQYERPDWRITLEKVEKE